MRTAEEVRSIATRLVIRPSVSPDPVAELACGRTLGVLLPPKLERGEWTTPDGRPVVWALTPGRAERTVLLLGHYDTVGTAEFEVLGTSAGGRIAFDPAVLRSRLIEHARSGAVVSDAARADLEEEARHPGTWMFGRGALDMKSGLAAAIAAMEDLSDPANRPSTGALFVATPDEEHQSVGMKTAVAGIERMRDERGLRFAGALNLDYCLEPALYAGVTGKLQLGCYVIGKAAHVADPSRGPDALEIAAHLISAVTRDERLIDRAEGRSAAPPMAMRLDDLRSGYSIEPVVEAVVELNVLSLSRSLGQTLEMFRSAIAEALTGIHRGERGPTAEVLTWSELVERAGADAARIQVPRSIADASAAARTATLARMRALSAAARLVAPAVVLHLFPPFYPAAAPGEGPLVRAARALAGREELPVHGYYPFISDASYVAWRSDAPEELARQFPSLGHEYTLPWREARALDLDVVNLGPWGRDAHGLCERVRADYAFQRLPRLIESLVRETAKV